MWQHMRTLCLYRIGVSVSEHETEWLTLAASAPSADNGQRWRLERNGHALNVYYRARGEPSSLFTANDHATLMGIGAMARLLELGGARIAWRDLVGGAPYFAAQLPNARPHDLPFLLARHSNRNRFKRAPLSEGVVGQLRVAPREAHRVELITERARIGALAKAVSAATAVRFGDQAEHESLMHSLRFTPQAVERGDGLDLAVLNLPPLGGTFMRFISPWPRAQALHRIGLRHFLGQPEGALFASGALTLAVVGPQDCDGTLAGAQMIDAWLACQRNGLHVHPFYVVTAQWLRARREAARAPESEWQRQFGSEFARVRTTVGEAMPSVQPHEMVHMLLRVGHGSAARARARRLPQSVLQT
jgi:hypothetical protein